MFWHRPKYKLPIDGLKHHVSQQHGVASLPAACFVINMSCQILSLCYRPVPDAFVEPLKASTVKSFPKELSSIRTEVCSWEIKFGSEAWIYPATFYCWIIRELWACEWVA